jgi:hypothetical protein
MAIGSFDGFIASSKNYVSFAKIAARTSISTAWFTTFDVQGNPAAAALAGTSTTAGVIPTSAMGGYPTLAPFGAGATGYLAQVDFGSSVSCRLKLFDTVWKAGAYSYASGTTTLTGQPAYDARIPNGDFTDTQIWVEVTTAFATGTSWQVVVTYTNELGVTGRVSTATANAAANLTVGRMYQIGLQAGDCGVRKIESVVVTNGGTAMTAGAFNVLVNRNIWSGRVKINNDGDVHDLAKTGMPIVFPTSALMLAVASDGTNTGVPELEFVIANG